jgi:hypothetical protein
MKALDAALLGFAATLLLAAAPASARETFHDIPVEDATKSARGMKKLLDVPFYMGGQAHPPTARDLGEFKSNRRTNAFGKSDQKACQIAFLSALISLQERARREGGDAVVDVKSVTKHRDLESPTEFRCVAGTFVANVALTGRVVRLSK